MILTYLNYVPCKLTSQRIPQKNIKIYSGKRLIDYTLDFTQKTGWRTLVSSEDAQVLTTFTGVETHLRCPELASNTLTNLDVMQSIFRAPEFDDVSCIVLLQPTHPLRRLSDIKAAAELFQELEPDIPMVSVRSPKFHGTAIDRRKFGDAIDGRYYLFPLEYVRTPPVERAQFIGCFSETAFHVDIDTSQDEEEFLAMMSTPEALREDGYDV